MAPDCGTLMPQSGHAIDGGVERLLLVAGGRVPAGRSARKAVAAICKRLGCTAVASSRRVSYLGAVRLPAVSSRVPRFRIRGRSGGGGLAG